MKCQLQLCLWYSRYEEHVTYGESGIRGESKYPVGVGGAKDLSNCPGGNGAKPARSGVGFSGRNFLVSNATRMSPAEGEIGDIGEYPPGANNCHPPPGMGNARMGEGASLEGETSSRVLRLGCLACVEVERLCGLEIMISGDVKERLGDGCNVDDGRGLGPRGGVREVDAEGTRVRTGRREPETGRPSGE